MSTPTHVGSDLNLTVDHAAAAVMAAGLARATEPLTGEQCAELATAEGYTRRAARDGLEWAVSAGLIRRTQGPRTAQLHELATPPHRAGGVGAPTSSEIHNG